MKINKLNLIPFEKQLKAACAVLKNGVSKECKIYRISYEEDKDYYKKEETINDWEDCGLWETHRLWFEKNLLKDDTYVLESENKPIGITHVITKNGKKSINTLAKCPKSDERGYKYIGETLVAYLARLCKQTGKTTLIVPHWFKSAEKFYVNKCGFKNVDNCLCLDEEGLDKLISQNESHTGKKLEITG